jgi:hypothetical protein
MSPAQLATLIAAMDRFIPADDFPSASGSDVDVYVRRLLATDLRHRATEFATGLDRIDAVTRSSRGKSLVDLTTTEQDAVLAEISRDPDATNRRFFDFLVDLVTEGYYADPANGGNRDAVSWTMVGYDPRVPGYDGGRAAQQAFREEFPR